MTASGGRIAVGADHAGFPLKEAIAAFLAARGFAVTNAGTFGDAPADYPDTATPVAAQVSSGAAEKGILVCGSGIGMAIVANRFPGVRAAVCRDVEEAKVSRRHNDANVLCLGARTTDADTAKAIVDAWLDTPFDGGRHQRRIDKIRHLEKRLCREEPS